MRFPAWACPVALRVVQAAMAKARAMAMATENVVACRFPVTTVPPVSAAKRATEHPARVQMPVELMEKAGPRERAVPAESVDIPAKLLKNAPSGWVKNWTNR